MAKLTSCIVTTLLLNLMLATIAAAVLVEVTADSENWEENRDVDADFHGLLLPPSDPDEISVTNRNVIGVNKGVWPDPVDDGAILDWKSKTYPVSVIVEGRGKVGAVYKVVVAPTGDAGGAGGGDNLLYADVQDTHGYADFVVVLTDMNSMRATRDDSNAPPPPPVVLGCVADENNECTVRINIFNATEFSYRAYIDSINNSRMMFASSGSSQATCTGVTLGEHMLTVEEVGTDNVRKLPFVVSNLKIIEVPEHLYAGSTAWVPVKIQIDGMGVGNEGPEIRNPRVFFRLQGTERLGTGYVVEKWAKDDGMGATHGSGESNIYTLWVPISEFQSDAFPNEGLQFGTGHFRVECEIAPHGTANWINMVSTTESGTVDIFVDKKLAIIEPDLREDIQIEQSVVEEGESRAIHEFGTCWFFHTFGNTPHDMGATSSTCPPCDVRNAFAAHTNSADLETMEVVASLTGIPTSIGAVQRVKTRHYGLSRGVVVCVGYGVSYKAEQLKDCPVMQLGVKSGNVDFCFFPGAQIFYSLSSTASIQKSHGMATVTSVAFQCIGSVLTIFPPTTVFGVLLTMGGQAIQVMEANDNSLGPIIQEFKNGHEVHVTKYWEKREKGRTPLKFYDGTKSMYTTDSKRYALDMNCPSLTVGEGEVYFGIVRLGAVVTQLNRIGDNVTAICRLETVNGADEPLEVRWRHQK